VILSQDRNSIGTLKIGNGAGAGKLNALEVTGYQDLELGEGGTSTIIFNHSDANYMFAPGIYDRISLQQIGPGRTILTGAAGTYDYYGETLITDGALIPLHGLTNSFGAVASTVTVGLNGTLGGMGTIDGLTTVSGTLSPGLDGGGLLTFSSDLTLDSTATVKFELGGVIRGTSYDGVNVPAILNYGGTLELSLINGFQVHVGDTFRLFSAFTAFTGSFSDMVFDQPGFAGTYNHNNGLFTVTAVPEPTHAALLAASLLPFFATRRLRRI
jgi:hypothetical protein